MSRSVSNPTTRASSAGGHPDLLCIRPSGPGDRALLEACFGHLGPEARRLRFFGHKAALSPSELDLYTGVDGRDHIAFAAIRLDAHGTEGEALGFARCMRLPADPLSAELSITVVDHAQGQGIGAALMHALIPAARDQGIARLRCEVMAENTGMRALARQLGGEPHWVGDGTLEFDCALPEVPEATGPWELPWFADPHAWVCLCADAWLAGASDSLRALDAANDCLGMSGRAA